ncbi:IGF-like family receptor 1 [Embiotoca jacksoni]|uniref:IGF-like family receptor 1 n=1 Tax=Embiotoca jacksoni TaxID=100190 RepID=UPI0037039DB5
MGHSKNCPDLAFRWDREIKQCIPCVIKPGYQITTNCGFDDDGGQHEPPNRPCKSNTFNDGSSPFCKPCNSCPLGHNVTRDCDRENDILCHDLRSATTEIPVSTQTYRGSTFTPTTPTIPNVLGVAWAVPFAILILIIVVLSAWIVKRKRGQHTAMSFNVSSSCISPGFSSLSASASNNDLENILSPHILSAPLQTVLDNLDVLEELVILLDPESLGQKNTKHLASYCSFPSTWITYAYSMKDSKSPLKALLEGVTSRNPDWTVEHLAKLLKNMERNDAIAVLAKL